MYLSFFKGGAGNSNTGNVGRVLVDHAAQIAPIVLPQVPLEFAQALIEGLAHFLIAIKSKYVLDPAKFGALCAHVDQLMVQWVEWHPSVPSVHLDLHHGQKLMEHFFPIPLGWLSEVSVL